MTIENVKAKMSEAKSAIEKVKNGIKADWLKESGWLLFTDSENEIKTENHYGSSKELPQDSKVLYVDGKEVNQELENWVSYLDLTLEGDCEIRKAMEKLELRFMVNLGDTSEVQVIISSDEKNGERFMTTMAVRVNGTQEEFEKDLSSLECDLK